MMRPEDNTSKGGMPRFTVQIHRLVLTWIPLIFYDKMKIPFSDVRGKKSKY